MAHTGHVPKAAHSMCDRGRVGEALVISMVQPEIRFDTDFSEQLQCGDFMKPLRDFRVSTCRAKASAQKFSYSICQTQREEGFDTVSRELDLIQNLRQSTGDQNLGPESGHHQ